MPVAARVPRGHSDIAADWKAFRGLVARIGDGLAKDAPDLEIAALDGASIGRVFLADVRHKLDQTSWGLSTRLPGNGGLGAVHSDYGGEGWEPAAWRGAAARFHVQGFRDYAARGAPGLAYLVLHELAHITRLGLLVQNACWRRYLHAAGQPDGAAYAASPWYVYNEQVPNEIARRLAGLIGVELLPAPTYGSPPTALRLGLRG